MILPFPLLSSSFINKKILLQESKIAKNENNKIEREKKIREIFQFNKLEFKNFGDVYAYINYGKPDLETVVNNEIIKITNKHNRRIILANELKKLNILLDESLKSCYEYINEISTKPLDDVVRCIEIEYFLKHNTNYDKLLEKYDIKKARELAIRKYTETQNLPKNINNKFNIKLEFE